MQPRRLLQTLRRELNAFLHLYPANLAECAFNFGTSTFCKTRYCSHVHFISKCVRLKLIPKGFQIQHGGTSTANVPAINKATATCSRKIMRITLDSFHRTISKHDEDRRFFANNLVNLCTRPVLYDIRAFIHEQNQRYFQCLKHVKESKIASLKQTQKKTPRNQKTNEKLVVTIPEDLTISESERSVLAKGLKFIPINRHVDEFQIRQDAQQFYRRLRLKAHFHSQNQNDDDDTDDESNDSTDIQPVSSYLDTLQKVKSNFTPKEGQLPVLDFFIDKCENDINKLDFKQSHRRRNTTVEEDKALKSLHNNPDIVIKPADKGGAIVVWRKDLYLEEAERQLSDNSTYQQLDSDITEDHQELAKETIDELVNSNELPDAATYLINPLPRTSKFYLLPKIHKVGTPGRPIVSACNCPTERIAQYLDEILRPIVESLPTYVRDSPHALRILNELDIHDERLLLFTMDVKSLYTCIPHDEGLRALRFFLDQRSEKIPPPTHCAVLPS
ncbi:uncharacterized protein [Amphiura filiformis]|uniref:uncharacterized protein n=1 Tax=Amphiura filiformis TaxID=82378 RepID=UPI003B20D9D4